MNDIANKWRDDFGALIHPMNPKWKDYANSWDYLISYKDVCASIIAMKADMVEKGLDDDHPVVRMCGGVPLALLCMLSAVAREV
jgi:hypothetical protein